MTRHLLAAIGFVVRLHTAAFGQTSTLTINDWSMVPVKNSAGTSVTGILALRDPFEALLEDSDYRATLLADLVAWGYSAAAVPLDAAIVSPGCATDSILEPVHAAFSSSGSAETVATSLASALAVTCSSSWCFPWSWSTETAWGAWACGPWRFAGSVTTPGPSVFNCMGICHYVRDTSRAKFKTIVSRHLDCSRTTAIYKKREYGIQTGTCPVDLTSTGCSLIGAVCQSPPNPCDLDSTTLCGPPDNGTSRTWWELQ